MTNSLKLLLFILTINFGYSQDYTVSYFQKINELGAGFSGVLNEEDNFGVSIDNIGDLDGNGVNDLAVGAFFDDDGGTNRGAIWILFLDSNDMVIAQTKISSTSGGFTGVLDNGDRFGGSVAYLGDINNDGFQELAVGADYDEDGGFGHGAVWILSLNPNGTVNAQSKISDTEGGFNGSINGDVIFGSDVANLGDLNGDGVQDIAVGARQDNDGGATNGAIWILFLNNDLTVNSYQKISENQGGFNVLLDDGDFFGSAIANIGDLNGDGVVDIAVGSYRDDDILVNSGSVYILFLNADGTVNAHQKISNSEGVLTNLASANALFGESIDGVVDIDGDGKVEIVVGAMNQINPTFISLSTGSFFIIELNSDGTVSEEHFYTYRENCFLGALESGVLFGGAVSFLTSDPNNLKIAIGSYRDSENGYRKGTAYILTLGALSYNIVSFTNPTGCGLDDGTITMAGFSPNTTYTISYNNGSEQVVTVLSGSNGELVLTGLPAGLYNDITINPDLIDCLFNLGQINLTTTGLSPIISSTNPTGCSSANNGSITVSGLLANTEYVISYNDGAVQTVTLFSDGGGQLILPGLISGFYDEIEIIETAGGCLYNLGQITLTASGLTPTISFTDTTNCNSDNGTATIFGLQANTQYSVNYTLGFVETITGLSNSNGEIVLINLLSGVYDDISIVDNGSGCSNSLGQITIGSYGVNAGVSFSNPADCNSTDGTIIMTDLKPNTEYTVQYNAGSDVIITLFSNSSGELVLSGLSSGLYTNITILDTETGCSGSLLQINLNCKSDDLKCIKTQRFFTPNNDGDNDLWTVKFVGFEVCEYILYIYDRFGKLLKTLTPRNNSWDGTYNGQNMSTNDYWYLVEYNYEGEPMLFRSHFTLKR